MKKVLLIMSVMAIALVAGGCLSGCSSLTPTITTADGKVVKLTKEEKKALRAYEDSVLAVSAMKAVMDSSFIAAADQVSYKRGRTVNSSSDLNYVSLNGTDAVIQVGNNVLMGANGVGGVTLEGEAQNIKLSTDKKGNVSFSMKVAGSGLSGDVTLQMAKGSNRATVQVIGTFSSQRITMNCIVSPYSKNKVVQGRSL